jgi:hypothetical protein
MLPVLPQRWAVADVTMTSTSCLTKSAANSARCSLRPSAHQYSMVMVRSLLTNDGEFADCCARATTGKPLHPKDPQESHAASCLPCAFSSEMVLNLDGHCRLRSKKLAQRPEPAALRNLDRAHVLAHVVVGSSRAMLMSSPALQK